MRNLGNHSGEELHDEMMEETAREVQEGMDSQKTQKAQKAYDIYDIHGNCVFKEFVDTSVKAGLIPNFATLFINPDNDVVRVVFYEQRPTVVDISCSIEEMKYDKDFGIGEEDTFELTMDIIKVEDGGDI